MVAIARKAMASPSLCCRRCVCVAAFLSLVIGKAADQSYHHHLLPHNFCGVAGLRDFFPTVGGGDIAFPPFLQIGGRRNPH